LGVKFKDRNGAEKVQTKNEKNQSDSSMVFSFSNLYDRLNFSKPISFLNIKFACKTCQFLDFFLGFWKSCLF
jgi:hypothetical protein